MYNILPYFYNVQYLQNVQYSTILLYTRYIAIFTCYMIFAAFIKQNLAQRFVKRGSDLYISFAPQMLRSLTLAKSSRSTFQWDWRPRCHVGFR